MLDSGVWAFADAEFGCFDCPTSCLLNARIAAAEFRRRAICEIIKVAEYASGVGWLFRGAKMGPNHQPLRGEPTRVGSRVGRMM